MKNIFYIITLVTINLTIGYTQDAYMNISHLGLQPSSVMTVELDEEITFEYGGGGPHPMMSGFGNGTPSPVFFPTITVNSGNPIEVFTLSEVGTYFFHCGTNPGNSSNWGTIHVEESEEPILLGDVNNDGLVNVLDIVGIVTFILGTGELEIEEAGDFNGDGSIDILDIVMMVNCILGTGPCN